MYRRSHQKRPCDKVYAAFPEETCHGGKKPVVETALKPLSLSSAWRRCGEGFDSTQRENENESCPEKKPQAVRHLMKSLIADEVAGNLKEPEDIAWSDSDLSNDGSKESLSQPNKVGRTTLDVGKSHFKHLSLPLEGSSGGEVPQITDWQDDSDLECEDEQCHLSETAESALEISDCESSSSNVTISQPLSERELPKVTAAEISEYSSDDLLDEPTLPVRTLRHLTSDHAEGGPLAGKSASEWVRTAQVLLQTPEKKTDKTCKTPEDSAKKRKKFLRGGLAERLNRLQNRERSAISFWRHQCESDCKMPLGTKSEVLILRIIEMHEECATQIALCQQLAQGEVSITRDAVTMLKVLLTRQTAAYLRAAPNDIIHIYPPWQKLTLCNENMPVILNTHFCQKHIVNQNEEVKKRTYCPEVSPIKRRAVPLSWTFKINDSSFKCQSESADKQLPQNCSNQAMQPSSCLTTNDSLLDIVETQGAAGWKGTYINVVVQRVYYLPSRDGCTLQGSNTSATTSTLNSEMADGRLCLLIQDAYGIFSELHLQSTSSHTDDLEQCSKRWEGKVCRFSGIKILQRTTRGRAPGLFSLIDSLWPPLAPINVHGQSQEPRQMPSTLPVPSFCYVLAVHCEDGVADIKAEADTSDLYLPPVMRSLRDMFQVVGSSQRCSFGATVMYMRPEKIQGDLPLKEELWIYVTDTTLQDGRECPKTLSVCISPCCVLDRRLLQTLCKKVPCTIWFKDAVKEKGRIICVERTVLSLQKPLLSCAPGVNELTGPVRLDVLDSTSPTNTLCAVKGVVVGVNERTAFSWPACNKCDSNKLQHSAVDRGTFFCSQCSLVVNSPVIKMQLEVFLRCELRPQCKVKVKLQQETIYFLLRFSSSEDGRYEMNSILGKEVGPLNCYVQSISSNLNSEIGLEEIVLLNAGS
ncbi:DNA repair-scaffolding protein isoform 2-T2 [Discoglossus pictus]